MVRWDGSRGGIEPSEQGSGGRIAVRVSGVRRGTSLQVGDRVEYAIGRKGDARFALDVMVYAPADEEAKDDDGGAVVTLANLNYDTKRYDLKEHIGSIVGKSFGRVALTAKGRATVGFRTLAQAEAGLLENGVFATGASVGKAPRYASLVQGLGTLRRDGNLWRGAGALVVRGALLSAGMQVGYDGFKTWAKRRGVLEDGPLLHGLAACAGGVGAGVCATPADVVMTRYQASSEYRSAFGAAGDILRKDGVLAFYRGFTPFVVRLGPVFLISLPLTEQIRRLAGLGYLN